MLNLAVRFDTTSIEHSNTHMTNLILFLTPAAVGITYILIHKLAQA